MNTDLSIRNIWVTSVDVTINIRTIKAVLLHLGQGLGKHIQGCWIKTYFYRKKERFVNERRAGDGHKPLACIESGSLQRLLNCARANVGGIPYKGRHRA